MAGVYYIGRGDGRVVIFDALADTWTLMPDHDATGSGAIAAISVLADDDIWIAGTKGTNFTTTLWHWSGGPSWTEIFTVPSNGWTSPGSNVRQFAPISSNSIFMGCWTKFYYWNGASWSTVMADHYYWSPADMHAISTSEVYIAHSYDVSDGNPALHLSTIMKWNGSSLVMDWTAPNIGHCSMAVQDASNIWLSDASTGDIYKGPFGGPWVKVFTASPTTPYIGPATNARSNDALDIESGIIRSTGKNSSTNTFQVNSDLGSGWAPEYNSTYTSALGFSAGLIRTMAGDALASTTNNIDTYMFYDGATWVDKSDTTSGSAAPTAMDAIEGNLPPVLSATPASPNTDITTNVMEWSVTDPDNQPEITLLEIEGTPVVVNDVLQSGYTGTVTVGGNRVDVSIVADQDYWPTKESITWDIEFTDGIVIDTDSGTITTPLSETTFDRVFVVAKDAIRLDFSNDLLSVGEAQETSNYTIVSTSGNPTPVVLDVLPAYERLTNLLFLKVQGLQYGGEYKLTIASRQLKDSTGVGVQETFRTWTMPRSKSDSVLQSLSGMYDTSPGSNIRSILEAITISDEEIGGDY